MKPIKTEIVDETNASTSIGQDNSSSETDPPFGLVMDQTKTEKMDVAASTSTGLDDNSSSETRIDLSKWKNPPMPVGYIKPPLKHFDCEFGEERNGKHFVFSPAMHKYNVSESEYKMLFNLDIVSDSEDEDKSDDKDEDSTISSSTRGKKTVCIKKEPVVIENIEKKDYENNDISPVPKQISKTKTNRETYAEGKKVTAKKGKKSRRRSDSSSPLPTHRHQSPESSHKHRSLGHRKDNHPSQDRRSDSSSRDRAIVVYSRSPSPEKEPDVKFKKEPIVKLEEPEHLFGSYHCETCNITMNSLLTFNTHINGKRHCKAMKLKSMSVSKNVPMPSSSAEIQSKYPKPPEGVIRKRVQKQSLIQNFVEKRLTKPCPGLSYVIEIQSLGHTQYYCELCDAVCSSDSLTPHLNGFKHQLHLLKLFKPGAYERMQFEPKYKVEDQIKNILYAVEKKQGGRGRISVEIEELASDSNETSQNVCQPSTSHRSLPSTSRETDSRCFVEYDEAAVPDENTSDYVCRICQSHMNSKQMWEAHIRGKRHLTNIKKNPGDKPSKTKTFLVPNKKAYLLERIKTECDDEPVVGLKEIRETEICETNSHSYQCFLCGSCHTDMDIIEHVISLKHRIKYLDHIDFPNREIIDRMSDTSAAPLVKEMCEKVESSEGSGNPEVHVNKSVLYR